MKFNHIAAVCCSEDNSRVFYRDILGLDEVKSYSLSSDLSKKIFNLKISCQVILFANDSLAVEVFIPSQFTAPPSSFMHNCIVVKDKDLFSEKCKKVGLNVNFVEKGDKTLLFVKDFDGNLYEIKE